MTVAAKITIAELEGDNLTVHVSEVIANLCIGAACEIKGWEGLVCLRRPRVIERCWAWLLAPCIPSNVVQRARAQQEDNGGVERTPLLAVTPPTMVFTVL